MSQQQQQIVGAITAAPAEENRNVNRDVEQPRQPYNLQSLLRFAMEATKTEDAPNDSLFGPLDEERKKFLENTLKSMTLDVIEILYKQIKILQTADRLKLDDDYTEYSDAFDAILEHADMIDTAIDFHKIGGFQIFPSCLNCIIPQIRASACDLIAELCQNNPYCQQVVVESDLMEQLINLLKKDSDENVQIKAMYAISCNVRENEKSTLLFLELNGLDIVIDALQRCNDKLRTKCAFLLSRLVGCNSKIRDRLVQNNSIPILIDLIGQERMPSHEHLLSLLWLLVLDNPFALDICTKEEFHLEGILRKHLKITAGHPEMADEHQHCELLLQAIISVDYVPIEADR